MKKIFLLTFIALFSYVPALLAEVVYVSSKKTAMYSNADRKASKVKVLHKGARLTVLSKKGSWLNVKFANKKGWVSKMVTSKKKPGVRISLLGSADKNARIHARKRASSDVTAASARGLMADNADKSSSKRTRAVDRGSNSQYSQEALSAMEKLYISEDDLMSFLVTENLQ